MIVVDDDSKGGSFELLERMAQQDTCGKVLCHDRNQGKWLALLTGINKASAPIILIHAVDLESDTENYAALLKSILRGKPGAVFGSHFRGLSDHRVLYFWHHLVPHFLTHPPIMTSNLNLTDMDACCKGFTRELIQCVTIEELASASNRRSPSPARASASLPSSVMVATAPKVIKVDGRTE